MIELIVVIVIIGILASIAVPRFIDLQGRAQLAVRDGLTSNLRSAAALAYANAAVTQNTAGLNATSVYQQLQVQGGVTLAGNIFSATVNGTTYSWVYSYPARINDPTP
jgi:type II secretory pathway pseudopilin PulG